MAEGGVFPDELLDPLREEMVESRLTGFCETLCVSRGHVVLCSRTAPRRSSQPQRWVRQQLLPARAPSRQESHLRVQPVLLMIT